MKTGDGKDSSKFDQNLEQHDPLCPQEESYVSTCECDLIAKARADERERIAQALAVKGWHDAAEEARRHG